MTTAKQAAKTKNRIEAKEFNELPFVSFAVVKKLPHIAGRKFSIGLTL